MGGKLNPKNYNDKTAVGSVFRAPTKISPTIAGYNLGDPMNLTGYKKEAGPAKPPPAPAPPDTTEPLMRELARAATDRELRRSKGRTAAFGGGSSAPRPSSSGSESYRAPGSVSTTGGR